MDHFVFRDGELFCEDLRLRPLAEAVGTPAYVYSHATIELHYRRLHDAFAPLKPWICFAVKSCPNLHVLRLLSRLGAGMDVVSGGELARARLAGVPNSRITFAGVGKTDEEIRDALGANDSAPASPLSSPLAQPAAASNAADHHDPIGLFNIESEGEFEVIALAARRLGIKARACLRVNPDVAAGGHEYISTARKDSKFGVDLAHAERLLTRFNREKHLRLCGVHMHIGSAIADTRPYVQAVEKTLDLVDRVQRQGANIEVLDLGGGFGADYTSGASPAAADYANAVIPLLKPRVDKGLQILLEPGRTIVANAGVLLTRVLYVKYTGGKKFIVCDAGMNTLIRPALYNAFHFIWPAAVSPQHEPPRRAEVLDLPGLERADVVGPVCESGDFLAKDRLLPPVARGDLLAVFTAGAYGMSMASRYNAHPLPPEIMVAGSAARIIRQRETLGDLVKHELETRDVAV